MSVNAVVARSVKHDAKIDQREGESFYTQIYTWESL